MSKYTTQVRFICETANGLTESKGYDDVNTIITTAAPLVFNFDFPLFDANYRLPLETKILRHFYTREIGCETVGLWKLRLQTKLNEIMPYYNQLYESALIEFNPMYSKNMNRTHTNKYASQTGGSSSDKSNDVDWNDFSDTPQMGHEGIEDNSTLTTTRRQTSDRTHKNDYHSMNLNTEDYIENISGYDLRSPSSMLKEFRETFLNIDMMIINELEELFMQVL